jgi:pimeloyl-ACP methyl ester carboxylesterase
MSPSTPATALLVHGACHGAPVYFEPLAAQLEYQGIPTVTTTCPSDNSEPPTLGMYDDAAHIRSVILPLIDAGKEVLLVMHSYGGAVGTEAAKGLSKAERAKEGKKGGVVHLYYLCAFMLQEGQSLVSCNEATPEMTLNAKAVDIDADGRGTFATPGATLYNDLLSEAQQYWASHLHHFTLKDNIEAITHATWKDIPSTYILCTQDQAIPIKRQEYMVQKVQDAGVKVRVERWECAHSPFLSMPAKVAESVAVAARL